MANDSDVAENDALLQFELMVLIDVADGSLEQAQDPLDDDREDLVLRNIPLLLDPRSHIYPDDVAHDLEVLCPDIRLKPACGGAKLSYLAEYLVVLDIIDCHLVILALGGTLSTLKIYIFLDRARCGLDRGEEAPEEGCDAERSELGVLNTDLVLLSLQSQISHYLRLHPRVQIEISA